MTSDNARSARRPEDFRFDTGAAWLDLLATVGSAYGPVPVERLSTVERLAAWLEREHLTPVEPPRPADLVRARELRETLRPLGLAAAVHRPVDANDLARLNDALAEDQRMRLERRGGRLVAAAPSTTAAALARLARQAAEHLTGPLVDRLRTCDDRDCGMLYLDHLGRRRWCSAEICGVRHRVRAHRERARR